MSGNTSIAPINVWDDKTFTYFKFPGNRDIPAIYMEHTDGSESIVNRTTKGMGRDVVVMQKVAKTWILRLGQEVLAVYNESYDDVGETNTTGTVSKKIVRKTKKSSP
jgi:type IV secretion system protein VirB9